MKNKLICLLLAAVIVPLTVFSTAALSSDTPSVAAGFEYQHDPMDNPYAMQDIVKDENAVYGFRPSESGSLKQYAEADWSDTAVVAAGRAERIAYHNSIESMYDKLREMYDDGKSAEEIARTLSKMRNDIRIESYHDDPEGLAKMKERNLEKYGHEEGPLPDELYEQYGSWEKVTEKAFSVNVGMDACLGLYDDYYFLYVALGQVAETRISGDADGDGTVTIIDATAIHRTLASLPVAAFDEEAADADGDSEVTVLDATAIRRYLAELPCPDGIGQIIRG